MIEPIYYAILAAAFALAVVDWRLGLYLCLAFDVVRDPVRKLAEGHLVYITVSAATLWIAVFVGMLHALGQQVFSPVRMLPSFRNAINLLLLGLIPAAMVSVLSYSGGWKIAAVGFASYTLPIMGTIVGFHLPRRSDELWRLLRFYCLVNAIMLAGTIFEFLKYDWPVLGGINMVWVRQQTGHLVELISGFYRSPDVMGLHAANLTMFSTVLSMHPRTKYRWFWFAVIIWGTVCLFLSGRRKMIGMLLVFAAVYLGLRMKRTGFASVVPFFVIASSVGGAVFLVLREGKSTEEYATYAQTAFTEGSERFQENVIGGVVDSLQQSGMLGLGLGTATQGRYYVEALQGAKTWQEDGISRIFAELGLIGALCAGLAVANLLRAAYLAWRMVPVLSHVHEIQIGLVAIIAASAASFIISHQAFSGDPCALLLVSLLFGVLLSGPIQVVLAMMAYERRTAALEHDTPRPQVGA
ncbi:MAG TPA: hypothetical protein VGM05_07860 [Planctomycetaceae bacterium]|jgi:hypothetical protein